jgi:hypothetical protein
MAPPLSEDKGTAILDAATEVVAALGISTDLCAICERIQVRYRFILLLGRRLGPRRPWHGEALGNTTILENNTPCFHGIHEGTQQLEGHHGIRNARQ